MYRPAASFFPPAQLPKRFGRRREFPFQSAVGARTDCCHCSRNTQLFTDGHERTVFGIDLWASARLSASNLSAPLTILSTQCGASRFISINCTILPGELLSFASIALTSSAALLTFRRGSVDER
jgi:hypothetical protein